MKATPNRANDAGAAVAHEQPRARFCQQPEPESRPEKEVATLRSAFALRGVELRLHPEDDGGGFVAVRWGYSRHLPNIDAARRFLAQIGGAA